MSDPEVHGLPPFRPLPDPPPPWRRALDLAAGLRASVVIRPRVVAVCLAVVLTVIGLLAATVGTTVGSTPPPEVSLPKAAGAGTTIGGGAGRGPSTVPTSSKPAVDSVIDVAGAVAHPGVYHVAASSRVTDAVTVAGGPAADADLDQVNLAAPVADGDRVYVPRHGEAVTAATLAAGGPGPSGSAAAAVVDINTGSATDLDALPGVGPAVAAAIVEYRLQHGRFGSIDALLDVPGIGPAKLAALRSRVRL